MSTFKSLEEKIYTEERSSNRSDSVSTKLDDTLKQKILLEMLGEEYEKLVEELKRYLDCHNKRRDKLTKIVEEEKKLSEKRKVYSGDALEVEEIRKIFEKNRELGERLWRLERFCVEGKKNEIEEMLGESEKLREELKKLETSYQNKNEIQKILEGSEKLIERLKMHVMFYRDLMRKEKNEMERILREYEKLREEVKKLRRCEGDYMMRADTQTVLIRNDTQALLEEIERVIGMIGIYGKFYQNYLAEEREKNKKLMERLGRLELYTKILIEKLELANSFA